MQVLATHISGCFELRPIPFDDFRGRFVKVFHEEVFRENNLETNFFEEYYSTSKKDVIRGMHFQTPPFEEVKMVYCVDGRVKDVVIDLRLDSETYGDHFVVELSDVKANSVYIPPGCAHGFCVLSESATMVYKTSKAYVAEHDSGILWSSIGIAWGVKNPILSERDRNFCEFSKFKSPFSLGE